MQAINTMTIKSYSDKKIIKQSTINTTHQTHTKDITAVVPTKSVRIDFKPFILFL